MTERARVRQISYVHYEGHILILFCECVEITVNLEIQKIQRSFTGAISWSEPPLLCPISVPSSPNFPVQLNTLVALPLYSRQHYLTEI